MKGTPVTRAKLGSDNIHALHNVVLRPLLADFRREANIVASDAEVDRFMKFIDQSDTNDGRRADKAVDNDDARRALREVARNFVLGWKTSRALYERYGGEVIFQQSDPLEPVGAHREFLREKEREGEFEIPDKETAAAFWEYFTKDHGPRRVAPEKVDYSVPWWEKSESDR